MWKTKLLKSFGMIFGENENYGCHDPFLFFYTKRNHNNGMAISY